MNCLEFRRIRLSEPFLNDTQLHAHRQDCGSCAAFEAQLRHFDQNIYQAFNVEVPDGLGARILLAKDLQPQSSRQPRWSWLSLAASVLVVGVISFYQISAPASIDRALTEHIRHERDAEHGGMSPIQDNQINQVLKSINLDNPGSLTDVQFAANCIIDGYLVGHFVLKRDETVYTFFVLPSEADAQLSEFTLDHQHGLLLPREDGSSIAVVTDDGGIRIDRETMLSLATEISAAIKPLTR